MVCACACVCGLEFNNKYGSNTNQRGANYKKIFNGVCVCVCVEELLGVC